ncbi:MAG: chemotaxis protein [Gammaproteobacteria bacterium]
MAQPGNSPRPRRSRMPLKLLALDIAGALVAAVGLYELFAGGPPLVPPSLQFPGYAIAFLIVGALMMMPLVRHILSQGRPD